MFDVRKAAEEEKNKKKSKNEPFDVRKAVERNRTFDVREKVESEGRANHSSTPSTIPTTTPTKQDKETVTTPTKPTSKFANSNLNKTTDYYTELGKATDYYKGLHNTTTIASDLSEDERKARIEEIEYELSELSKARSGLSRASMYGNVGDLIEQNETRRQELEKELQELERVGTVSGADMLQWEIEDAKKRVSSASQKVQAFGPRPSADVAEEYQAASSELYKAQQELEALEEKYKIHELGDVAHTETGNKAHDFFSQWGANYRLTDISEKAGVAMSDYMGNPTEENLQRALSWYALYDEYAKNNEAVLDDKGQVLPLLSNNFASQLAQQKGQAAWGVPLGIVGGAVGAYAGGGAGAKAGWTTGYSAGSGLHSYQVIRGSLFNELISYGMDEETAYKLANDDAIIESLIESGETAKDWAFMLFTGGAGKVVEGAAKTATKYATKPLLKFGADVVKGIGLNAGTEYIEEFSQGGVSRATREKALSTIDNEIGQYGKGNIDLHNRPIYKNADGSISTVDSVTYTVDGKYILLPTIVRDENGEARRLTTDEEIFAHYEQTGEYLGVFDTLDEANLYANRLHSAQMYRYSENTTVDADDNSVIGGVKVIGDALFGGNKEALSELHAQGKEGFKTGLISGGIQGTARNIVTAYGLAKTDKRRNEIADIVINDEEALNTLIEEGKASGEGTVSAEIATEIETTIESGKEVTREQVKKLIASNEVYIQEEQRIAEQDTLEKAAIDVVNARNANQTGENEAVSNNSKQDENLPTRQETVSKMKNVPLRTQLEEQSKAKAPLDVEDVKTATGFGENGARLVTEIASQDGMTFQKASDKIKVAYLSGYNGENITFTDALQSRAKIAGIDDRIADNQIAQENAKNATIYNGAFTENKHTKNLSRNSKTMISIFAKGLGMDIGTVDKIIASKTIVDGVEIEHEANARHTDGKMTISENILYDDKKVTQKIITAMLLHEGGHRMNQLAPQEFGVLMDALYQRAEHLTQRQNLGVSQGMRFDDVVDKYGTNAGLSLDTRGYIEEIAAKELEKIFSSPREFNKWYAEISGNKDVRTAFEKFMDFVLDAIEKIKNALKYAKMTKAERAEYRQTLAELERIKELYANALRAAENVVAERQQSDVQSNQNLESKINEEYNGNVNYALKDKQKGKQSRYNEYHTIGMQWAYSASTKIGDRKVLFKQSTGNFVLVEATKEDVGFIELNSGSFEQMTEERNFYEETKRENERLDRNEETVDKVLRDFGTGRNNDIRNNVNVRDRGKGIQNAEVSEGKPKSNGTADIKTSDGDLNKVNFSLKDADYQKDSDGKTLTKEQQEYFKDSKVRDENGNLLVVYHGTSKGGFTIFDTYAYYSKFGLFGNGAYFTDSKEIAESYSKKGKGTKPQIYSSYLNITNPIDMDAKANIEAWNKALQKTGEDFTSLEGEMTNEQAFKSMVEDLEYMEVYSYDASEIVRSVFENMGYDGITHIGGGRVRQSDGTKHRVFISFEPEQIKNIDNTKPTNNPDIRYSLKDSEGKTLSKEQVEFFKDSEVRDENGNLLVCYHGTNAKFTTFDADFISDDNKLGIGFYFMAGKELQYSYDNPMKVYLNIINPITDTSKKLSEEKVTSFCEKLGIAIDYVAGDADLDVYERLSYEYTGDKKVFLREAINILGVDGVLSEERNVAVAFDSEQAKLTSNKKPTNNPDTRFSLKEPVEQTKNLIAVHNVWDWKLRQAFELGGLPSPSIAITKNDFSHDNFGDISLIFYKDTISPTDRRNKVYGGDAYTPTRQEINYKVSDKTLDKISDRIRELVDEDIRDTFRLFLDSSNVESELKNHNGNFVEAYKKNNALKIAFLREKGIPFRPVIKTKELSQSADNIVLRRVARAIGEDTLKKAISDSKLAYEQEPMIRKLLNDRMEEQGAPRIYDKHLSAYQVDSIIRAAREYIREGEKKVVDYYATQDRLNNKFTKKLTAEYENWLAELSSDVIEKKGIRNDRDLFTPSGNRRSFEALHWDYTLENIVKSMNGKQDKGSALWGGNVFGASTKEYGSIADIKADSSRLQEMTDEEYEALKSEYKARLTDIAKTYANGKGIYDAGNALIEAIATKKTKQGIRSYLAQYDYVYKVTDSIVNDLWKLRNEIAEMPVSYFEAKPQRAVGFNEVAAAVIPRIKDKSLKTELENRGVKVLEYDKNKDGDRLAKINSVPNVAFSLKENNDLNTKDQKELLDIIAHLKGEFEVTKFAKAEPKKLAKMTRAILKDYSSRADYDTVFKAIDELYTYMANGENGESPVWADVYNRAYNIAQQIVENAVEVDDSLYNEYKDIREYLRTTPMKFDSLYDSVPAEYENFNEFRKRNYGRLLFTKDGASIDSVYQELSGMHPEFFDEYEATSSADQLDKMLDVLGSIQKMEVNPFDRHFEQASMHLANDLTSRFFDIPQAKPTFADKAERRVIEQGIKVGKKVQAVREQRDAKIKKLMESQKEKTKKQLDKIREQRDKKVKAEQEKRRKAISKMSEAQKVKVLRARITRHAGELSKKLLSPTDKQHIPQDLQGAVAKLLECINLESNYTYDVESGSYKKNDDGLPTRRTQAFNALKDLYEKMEGNVTIDPDLMGADGLLSEVIQLSDKRIVDMTSQELETVWQTLRAVEASISTANKMFAEGKFAEISEMAEALRTENADKKEKTELKGFFGKGKKLATLDMLTPETYLHCLGDAGDAIFRMMRDAQDKHISIMKEVSDFTHKTLKGVNVNSLEKTMHTVKLGGEDVKLSTAQLMELYVLMNREQATEHIYVGGILPDITQGKGIKLNTRANPIRNLTPTEISTALSELTAEEKKIADELQKFVSTVLSGYGNEASMKVYNYEKFLEKNYWTIRTNKQEIKSEVGKDTAVTSVANKGMAKGTKPHANTSVRIGSIFDTFASHSSDMATYAAWLGATEDINRIRNFVFWEDGARTGTVKGILDTVHGIHGAEYLQKLMTDISIGVKGTDNMNPFDKLIGSYKAASVGANLRVIIQQPTAILRAMDMIDTHYLVSGLFSPLKGWKKAKQYAPIAQWKDWGYFDINTGRQMKDVLFENASKLEKVKQWSMLGASLADSFAWGQLWNAVEAETRAKRNDLTVGSEEYYNAVAKRFTEIVDHTQVVDGILQRSQIMRSADNLTKMATSFMGEPTKQYNMAIAAAYDAKNSKGDAKKKAVNRLGRTAISLAVAGIINAAAQSIIDAMRDDDKEEDYWEKWLASFVGDGDDTTFLNSNLGDTVNPLNYVPFAKDIVSIIQGYDVKRMDAESITKTINAITNMYKAVKGESKYTVAEASAQLFAEIARLYGVPVANVKRDIKALFMSTAIETNNYVMQYRMEKGTLDINYSGNSKNFMDILYNAYANDREAYEIIYDDLLKSGYDADKIQSTMETRMKKAAGVDKSSDLAKRYMTPETEKQYDSSLNRIKTSTAWKSANETQRKDAEAALYKYLTSTSDDMVEMRAEATAFGVDETEYVLWQLAKDMAESNGNDSLNAKEKASALEMLDLGNSEITYFYATEQADEAFAYGIDMMNYAMFKASVNGLKGDDKKDKVISYANMFSDTEKEYLYFMGTVYPAWKNRSDYIRYFGN